jgi:hypothetical protein
MRAWGVQAFDNDWAGDWAVELNQATDLEPLEQAIAAVHVAHDVRVDDEDGARALAAIEVLARLLGNPRPDTYADMAADEWVARVGLRPSPELLTRARSAIDRVLANNSELREFWETDEAQFARWRAWVDELRERIAAPT